MSYEEEDTCAMREDEESPGFEHTCVMREDEESPGFEHTTPYPCQLHLDPKP